MSSIGYTRLSAKLTYDAYRVALSVAEGDVKFQDMLFKALAVTLSRLLEDGQHEKTESLAIFAQGELDANEDLSKEQRLKRQTYLQITRCQAAIIARRYPDAEIIITYGKGEVPASIIKTLAYLRSELLKNTPLPLDYEGIYPAQLARLSLLYQDKGQFVKAEAIARRSIVLGGDKDMELYPSICWYSLMLAIAYQGRLEEAMEYRNSNLENIVRAEGMYGSLEYRMQEDQDDRQIYESAIQFIKERKLEKGDAWWEAHEAALIRTQMRYGPLLFTTDNHSDHIPAIPKFNPSAAKLVAVESYFINHQPITAHSIKDLEKSLPTATGISGMQVKDYLTALVDDNKIRVEKIGSGNWYWCFKGDEKKQKENQVKEWEKEVKVLEGKMREVALDIEREQESKEGGNDEKAQRSLMVDEIQQFKSEKEAMEKELALYADNDPAQIDRLRELIWLMKMAGNMHTGRSFL
ncbi:hypothetical protein TWF694_005673 [Orbilia ellipsospora]|uniref:Mnd1 HTH domain-containing protein n=1 Tax=Orbilia ellipsospora TaxID=2528407 RepID=A0AAV9WRT5_9PEZI